MKILSLEILNVGLIENINLTLDKPLILFYGEVRQGKTTILNAVRWCLGGAFPQDIIRHGAEEACIRMKYQDGVETGVIEREFYRGKDGQTKAREILYTRNDQRVLKPATALQKFLNPFLLNQNVLQEKSELERKRFFVELFGLDTRSEDAAIVKLESDAKELRATLKGYGDIDTEPPATSGLDTEAIKASLAERRAAHRAAQLEVEKHNAALRVAHQAAVDAASLHNAKARAELNDRMALGIRADRLKREIEQLRGELANIQVDLEKPAPVLRDLPTEPVQTVPPPPPDTSDLEAKLVQASADAVRLQQHQKNLARFEQKKADNERLLQMERDTAQLRYAKIEKLKQATEAANIAGFRFCDDCSFVFEDTTAGMLSTSQLMRLSALLSAKYPDGMGVDLIDRAESLGESVFGLIERAKQEDKTILATIVGERPASSPPEVGVWVVQNGKLTC